MDAKAKEKVLKIFEEYNNKVSASEASLEETKKGAFEIMIDQLLKCKEFKDEFTPPPDIREAAAGADQVF